MKLFSMILIALGAILPSLAVADTSGLDMTQMSHYRHCIDGLGHAVDLFSVTGPGSLTPNPALVRPSIVTVNDWAYTGKSDVLLTQFVSDNGQLQVSITVNQYGNETSAQVSGRGFSQTYGNCQPTDLGGGSVSVHN